MPTIDALQRENAALKETSDKMGCASPVTTPTPNIFNDPHSPRRRSMPEIALERNASLQRENAALKETIGTLEREKLKANSPRAKAFSPKGTAPLSWRTWR